MKHVLIAFIAGFILTSVTMAQAEEDDSNTSTFNDDDLYPFTSTIQMNSATSSAPASGEFDDGGEDIDNLSKQKTGQDGKMQQNRRINRDNPKGEN